MMHTQQPYQSRYGLDQHGLHNAKAVHWNLSAPLLYEHALRRQEGHIAVDGPLVVDTGQYTGRAPQDKFIVCDRNCEHQVAWSKTNCPLAPDAFDGLWRRMQAYLQGRELFVQDCFASADPTYRLPLRIITETAWHSLFARNLLIRPQPDELREHLPQFTIIHAPNFRALPALDQTRSEVFIVLNFTQKLVLIGGTHYAGEIKKAIFTVLNYLLPQQGVLSMHCAANMASTGRQDVALFFGLSGTGKTTLSTAAVRRLIGDDEHAWTARGIFNLEGGCYAKVINLSPSAEPEIYGAALRFGTVLENVAFDGTTGDLNLGDKAKTENTRAAYPLTSIRGAVLEGQAGHPANILFLTTDAFGVLPPVARLTPAQAVRYFLLGYTAKVAGTENGVSEPQATFSPCFGAPFMALPPSCYARLFGQKIAQHKVCIWLVNTGWSGGPYGVGQRIPLEYTRAIVAAILDGIINEVPWRHDPIFDLAVPIACPDVPASLLDARNTWCDQAAYERQAHKLVAMFDGQVKGFDAAGNPRSFAFDVKRNA